MGVSLENDSTAVRAFSSMGGPVERRRIDLAKLGTLHRSFTHTAGQHKNPLALKPETKFIAMC